MASTYSDLKVELIGTGEQTGTWGTTTNNNLSVALGEAITGSADVTFTGADVTVTLTDTNAAQTARNLRLNLTGTSGGARNLILGSGCQIEKLYLINNGLADAVTVKNTTGTGIAVPPGTSMFVFNNGTNVVAAVTSVTTLTNSALTSGRVTYAGTNGLLQDSSNLTFNGTTLTANTIGAFTLGGTISGGGNQINNIVIGASTPLAGSFTTLSASGVATFSAGTVSAPALTTTGDTNTGIFFPAADTIAFTEGGVESMRIDSSGNVGIGNTPTYSRLDVVDVKAGANFSGITVWNNTTNATGVSSTINLPVFNGAGGGVIQEIGNSVDGYRLNIYQDQGSGVITFGTGGNNERMRITSTGNVGIGTSTITSGAGWTPTLVLSATSAALVVKGINSQENSFGTNNGLFIDCLGNSTGTNNNIIFRNTSTNSSFSSTERMRIDSSGNVGIGTSSPFTKFDSASARTTTLNSIASFNTMPASVTDTTAFAAGVGGGINFRAQLTSSSYNTYAAIWSFRETAINSDYRGSLLFGTSDNSNGYPIERMRIDSSGNVGIGTSSTSSTYILRLNSANSNLGFMVSGTQAFTVGALSGGGGAFYYGTGNVEAMRIDSSGNVGIGTSSPNSTLEINGEARITRPSVNTQYLRVYSNVSGTFIDGVSASGNSKPLSIQADTNSTLLNLTTVAAQPIVFNTTNTERMRITDQGYVGIGVTNPTSILEVTGGAGNEFRATRGTNNFVVSLSNNAGNEVYVGPQASSPLVFQTANAERMRITSGGDLCVGTTTSSAKFTVLQSSGNANGAFVTNQTWNYQSLGLHNTATSNDNLWVTFTSDASSFRGSIDYNRGSGVVRYNTTSDERLKENIVNSDSALLLINSVKIRAFNWKETGFHVNHGVIAQELKTVAPEAVSIGEDNEDGSIKRPWGVDTATLVPAMIKAIQEQQAMIEELKQEVAKLKGV